LAAVTSEFVAFLDSDCEPGPGWIDSLAEHFADPLVGAVAPRIIARPADAAATAAARPRAAAGSGLDLGDRAARVVPGTRVSYVPTAALLARRAALAGVARDGAVFDPALRYGEDVDLIWRLHEAGWRVRYDPSVLVPHAEPGSRAGLLARRFRYGTSAGPLAVRHPQALAPLALQPWPAVTVGGLLARKPAVAAAGFATAVLTMSAMLRQAGVPARGLVPATLTTTRQTWLGIGRYLTQFAAPLLVAGIARPGGGSAARRWGRRTAAASLLLGPPLTAWASRRPGIGPVPFALGHIADDVCYGAGVWAGAISAGTTVPLRPVLVRRPLRIEPRPRQARARAPDSAPGGMEHGL
jgi:mycofactocin system glycosyltransferase